MEKTNADILEGLLPRPRLASGQITRFLNNGDMPMRKFPSTPVYIKDGMLCLDELFSEAKISFDIKGPEIKSVTENGMVTISTSDSQGPVEIWFDITG